MAGITPRQGPNRAPKLPELLVEGPDDVAFISGLIARHGIETRRGSAFLFIKPLEGAPSLLASMGDAIRTSMDSPVGFVLDIDTRVEDRWKAVRKQLEQIDILLPDECPADGYTGKVDGYEHAFGVWLMPDCRKVNGKLEHLVETLIPDSHPLRTFARDCVASAATFVDETNKQLSAEAVSWRRFTEADRIKAEVRTWLAWQPDPGSPMGTAMRDRLLNHDSAEALAFIRWLRRLYPDLPREAAETPAT